jgi:hypothetical protein
VTILTYLNKNQVKAIEIALDALDMCLKQDIDPEKSEFATDILTDMKRKDREYKLKKKK